MTYRGIVRGRTIELVEEPPLPEGTEVQVLLSLVTPAKAEAVARAGAGMLKDLSPKQLKAFEKALARRARRQKQVAVVPQAEPCRHPEAELPLRPDVGTQAQFRKHKPPARYRYDSSLSPALDWDGQNHARELGEWLLALIEEASRLDPPHVFPQPREFNGGEYRVYGLHDAVQLLKSISKPTVAVEASL